MSIAPFTYEVPCEVCPLRAMDTFRSLSDEELGFIKKLKTGELRSGPGTTVLREGTQSDHLFTVLEGWAFRYKILEDGRRQITSFVLPGDFIGLQSSTEGVMDHSVDTLTSVALCTFPRTRIWEIFKHCPSLAFDLTWLAASHEIILNENLLSVGRRRAEECVAYYIVHLYVRASDVGLAVDGRVRFPFTQEHLADAIGLSLVHTNKTLRRLSKLGLMEWEHGWCTVPNLQALAELAKYDLTQKRKRPLL